MKTFEEWYEESGEFLTQHEIGMTDLMEAAYLAGQKSMDDMVIEYKADAERYRWLCDGNGQFMEERDLGVYGSPKEEADKAIDKYRLSRGE